LRRKSFWAAAFLPASALAVAEVHSRAASLLSDRWRMRPSTSAGTTGLLRQRSDQSSSKPRRELRRTSSHTYFLTCRRSFGHCMIDLEADGIRTLTLTSDLR